MTYELKLIELLQEYALEKDMFTIKTDKESNILKEYHIKTPMYWTQEYKEKVYKRIVSDMNNYCNENELWSDLLKTTITFD